MGERAAAGGRAVSAFMNGYRAALEDIEQALLDVPCRCTLNDAARECLIYRRDVSVIVLGAIQGCPCEPP